MTFEFGKLKMREVPSPPLMVLYGGPGIGKTAFGVGTSRESGFKVGKENHLLLNVDSRGADRLTCQRATDLLGKSIDSTQDLNTVFKNLAEKENPITWLVVDDLTSLEEMFVREVCTENGVSEIGKIEYGKGYELARTKWHHLFKLIKQLQEIKPIAILLIGHTKVDMKKDPMSDSYSRHDLQLDKRSKEIIKKSVDLIGFAHRITFTAPVKGAFNKDEVKAVGDGKRVISFAPDMEGFESKDRFNLPKEIDLEWAVFEKELNNANNNTKKNKEVK